MFMLKLFIVSFGCLVFLGCCGVQCAEQRSEGSEGSQASEVPASAASEKDTTAQSAIYKIKRLNTKDKLTKQRKPQKQQQLQPEQNVAMLQQQKQQQQYQQQQQAQEQQQQQHQDLGDDLTSVAANTNNNKPPRTKKWKNFAKNTHGQNKKLLSKLGFTKVKAPNSHNRKRLAVESRRHASPDDSHMFIIKLPPNLYYYASPKSKAGGGIGSIGGAESSPKNALLPQTEKQTTAMLAEVLNANGKKVSFPFSSNGKPGRIYHWNLPVIKKLLEDKQRFPNVAAATKDQLIDIKDTPTWTKPWEENDTIEKSYGKSSMMSSYKKSLKRKSPSYYAPANAVNKNSFNKYFSGNGKPKGFYVIKENQKKPLYYKNIVS